MIATENAQAKNPEHIYLKERFAVVANAILQKFGLEGLPFVETFFSVSAKIEGIRKELTRIDSGMRVLKSSNEKGSEIKLYTVSPQKLEGIKRLLRLVKIPIHEIKTERYVDAREQFFYVVVVYRGK